jgi:hypothetical protein
MAGALTISTLNNDTGVLATQNGMTGIAKAWVNFNGTGTVAIRSSFNVSSITDNGTGDYTITFTTALPNANYAIAGFTIFPDSTVPAGLVSAGNDYAPITGSVRIGTVNCTTAARIDAAYVNVVILSS